MKKSELKALWNKLEKKMASIEGDDADVPDETIVGVLHEAAHPVYQTVFNKGHSDATQRSQDKITAAESRATAAEAAATAAKEEANELRAKTPEAEKLKQQYDEAVKSLKKQHQQELDTLKEQNTKTALDRATADLRAKLVGRPFNLDPDYAEVIVNKPDVRSRMKFTNGALEVLQPGKDIPFAASEGQSPLDLLASELKKSTPAKFIVSKADGGAGSDNDAGGGASGGLKSYRKTVEAEREAERKGEKKSAKERMGIVS